MRRDSERMIEKGWTLESIEKGSAVSLRERSVSGIETAAFPRGPPNAEYSA